MNSKKETIECIISTEQYNNSVNLSSEICQELKIETTLEKTKNINLIQDDSQFENNENNENTEGFFTLVRRNFFKEFWPFTRVIKILLF